MVFGKSTSIRNDKTEAKNRSIQVYQFYTWPK